MRQQINLYQSMFWEKRELLSLRNFGIAALVLFILLFFVQVRLEMRQSALEFELKEAELLQGRRLKEIEEFNRKYPLKEKNALLEQEIARMGEKLEAGRPVMEALAGEDLGNERGFSPQLEALGRSGVEGLWLERIALRSAGGRMNLAGSMLDPSLAATYLSNLSREDVFAGQQFSRMELARPEPDARSLRFHLDANFDEADEN